MANSKTKTILAVESSTKACSVSLLYKDKNYTEFAIAPQQHANFMLEMVEKVLDDAKIRGEQVDILALCKGPGAFTGVRIATGVIQGLAYGWGKPVISITSLEALAWQDYKENGTHKTIACLDARMKELYLQECQVINNKLKSSSPQIISAEIAIELIKKSGTKSGIGDIAEEFIKVCQEFDCWQNAYPNAKYIAQIASQRIEQAKVLTEEIPQPLYLRNNIAVKKDGSQ